jgi:carboxypeptidase C (cathepsin A)
MVLDKFPSMHSSQLFLIGESYGGKYVPWIAERFLASSRYASQLVGIAIGNGLVDPINQSTFWSSYAGALSFVDAQQTLDLAHKERQLVQLISTNQYSKALQLQTNITASALELGAWFSPTLITTFGFPQLAVGEAWLQAHRSELRVSSRVPSINGACNDDVAQALANDYMRSVAHLYADLLDRRRLRVLIFNGNLDFTIPTTSVANWLAKLSWSGSAQFNSAQRSFWRTDAHNPFAVGGYVKVAKNLTFVAIPNAGHQVKMLLSSVCLCIYCCSLCLATKKNRFVEIEELHHLK